MNLDPPNHLPAISPNGDSSTITPDNEASVLAYANQIDLESYESLNGMPADGNGSVNSWLALADDNIRVYELGDIDGVTPVYSNDIQNAVIAITDRQSREPVQSSIEPISVGETPVVFFVGPPMVAQQLGLDPVFVVGATDPESGQQIEPPPLPQEMAEQLPPEVLSNGKFFVQVNSEFTAEFYQSLFDATWQRSRLDQWFRSNVLQTNIAGWQFALYEFDHETKKVLITELSVHQVRMDPTVSTMEKAAYAGAWLLIDENWAFRKYPNIAGLIESESRLGNPLPTGSSTDPLAEYMSVNFRRKMLVMQIWWFRNQFVKLTEDQAIAGGHILDTQVPIEQEASDATESGQQQGNDFPEHQGVPSGQDVPENQEEAREGEGQQAGGGGGDASGGEAPQPIDGTGNVLAPPPVPTRRALIHSETKEEIGPDHESWPVRLGLGRLIIINNHVAAWVEEDGWDIPLLHNVCIPIPRKPWGIGEPYRLLNMQRAYNRVWGSMVDHCDWNAHPPCVISQAMYAATTEVYKEAKVKPGVTLIIDNETFAANGGKLDVTQPLPPMAAHLPQVEERMSQKLSESSGNTNVMQGHTDTEARSGRAIELLQSAGESTISLKAQNSGDMIYRLDRHILHDLSRSFGVEDAMKVVKKYPPQVVRYMLAQGAVTEMEFTVSIAGGGAVSQAKRQKDQQDLQMGAISMETYRDRHNIDHQQEQARIAQQGGGQRPPSEAISFKDLPDSGKIQLASQAGIQLSPQDMAAHQQQQAQQQAARAPQQNAQPQGA